MDEKKVVEITGGGAGGYGEAPVFLGGGSTGQSFSATVDLKTRQHNLSFVEPGEQQEAQDVIDAQFRELTKGMFNEYPDGVTLREHARFTRFFAAVKIYVRPEELKEITDVHGKKTVFYLPDSVRAEDRYQSCVGLVVALGPQAFTDKDGNPRGCKYSVGDWVVFSRPDLMRIDFCDIPMGVITDDRSVVVTDDPRFWSVGSITYKA
jgi:hypothetical protein